MTRILRLLLIAAIALPMWQPVAAQKAQKLKIGSPDLQISKSTVGQPVVASEGVQFSQAVKAEPTKKKAKKTGLRSSIVDMNITICDGTDGSSTATTNKYVPIYGYYLDGSTYGQMIYPEATLGLQKGDVIEKIVFYGTEVFNPTSSNYTSTQPNVTLRLGKTSKTTIASSNEVTTNRNNATSVFTGTMPSGNETVTFNFSDSYTYNGGNLIVDLYRNSGNTCTSNTFAWNGVDADLGSSYYYYYYNTQSATGDSQASFLPKMTIYFKRTILEPYEATFEGNGVFGNVVVDQKGRATFIVTNTGANPFTPVVTITGDQEFTLKNTAYGELAPGESRYYQVIFAPTALQSYNGTITLTAQEDEATDINSSIALSGTGSETAQQSIGEGNDTNNSLPVYLSYLNYANHGQVIYKASDLNLTKGTKIKKITFYANNILEASNGGSSNPVTLKIGETTQSTYSSTTFISTTGFTSTVVNNIFTGTKSVTFEFSGDGYEYQGGNLVIDASCASGGNATASSVYWVGDNTTTNVGVIQFYSSNYTYTRQFLPMITIDCVPKEIEARDITVLDPDDWGKDEFKYDWYVDGNTANDKNTSYLNEVATYPDQIIAMLKKVYTTKSIPGNYKRGFTETGGDDHDNDVLYTGVGTLTRTGTSGTPTWYNAYGWGEDLKGTVVSAGDNKIWYMQEDQYKPNKEGLTLLLLEMVDNFDPKKQNISKSTSTYAELRTYFKNAVKSARIITDAKRTGEGLEAGTLFKIDCDKMNKFYLIAKGQVMWFQPRFVYNEKSYYPSNPYYNNPYFLNATFSIDGSNVSVNEYLDWGLSYDYLETCALLGHMFEQFSPSVSSTSQEEAQAKDDIYQDLINMESFGVIHDCPNVPYVGHHFMMYGEDSEAADCQDVRDMMFFVPDYRMMDWTERGNAEVASDRNHDYFAYNPVMQPTMGLYVIRQHEITPTTQADDYYMLNLNWVTNLDDFLPSDEQEFELLEVVVDENTGVESYVPVYYMNEQGKYTDAAGNVVDEANKVPIVLIMSPGREKNYPNVYVKREEASKQVTYAIRGWDAGIKNDQGQYVIDTETGKKKHFLSLQISNRQSYIIPGTDPTELVLLKDATHYSRFDAENVRNAYSNKIVMNNNVDGMKQSVLESNNVQMTISRVAQVPTGSTAGVTADPVTIATVTFNPTAKTYTVQMANQAADETEFPKCQDGSYAGYHANNFDKDTNEGVEGNGTWTKEYEVNGDGTINLGSMIIFDNFVQAIPNDNSHPFGYIYNVTTTYPCPSTPTSVYMSVLDVASTINAGNPVYYANTWNDGDTEAQKLWVKGVNMDDNNILFKFTPVKDNIIFVRMDPAVENEGNEPNWGLKWNQSPDLRTSGNMGKTYYIHNDDYIWDMSGGWSGDITADNAHGNTFRIPIYKTSSQINGYFAQNAVEGDTVGTLGLVEGKLPTDFEFGVGVQYISKTEILRYDTYRWPEGDPRYSVASADGDDEQDLPPTGLAMNQGEYYSISMNPDTDNETNGQVTVSSGSGTATFVDEVPAASSDAGAYIYAPIVEAFSGRGEGDYNSYGGPLQSAAVGKLKASVTPPDLGENSDDGYMSTYNWTDENGNKYAYYKVTLSVTQKDIPDGYQLYKVRAWRQVDNAANVLGEEYEALEGRIGANVKFVDVTFDTSNPNVTQAQQQIDAATDELGVAEDHIVVHNPQTDTDVTINFNAGTFGARKVGNPTEETGVIEQIDMNFKVRMYFTRMANLTASKDAASGKDDKYYIVEQEIPFTISSENIITGIENIKSSDVVGIEYYNPAGIKSNTPFQGVNIVVTRYSDGSTTTTKILK